MSRSKKLPLLKELHITDIAAEGKSIAKHDGMVVFVKQAVPGDVADVQIVRKRKRYMEGYPVQFHVYSNLRDTPFCTHFGICGGCIWQQLPYDQQLAHKQKQVYDQFTRIGKSETGLWLPIVGSPETKHYRNKLEYTFSSNRWLTQHEIQSGLPMDRRALGFHIPEKFDKILDIQQCFLQPEPSNSIRLFIRDFAIRNDLEFYHVHRREGLLRNLIIRNNSEGEYMVILSVFRDEADLIHPLFMALAERFPEIISMYYVVNPKGNDTLQDLNPVLVKGVDHLEEKMENLKFIISPKSFFQTNSHQALALYRIVREFADLRGNETVYDLYTGTGTIALFLATHCDKVIGMDYEREAIGDAIHNANINDLGNATFIAGDVRDLLGESFVAANGRPDVLITDPPRAGMHPDVVASILSCAPSRIVYVSCNPATQARDIELLSTSYRVVKVQPVDMFPHTHHVENVALLETVS